MEYIYLLQLLVVVTEKHKFCRFASDHIIAIEYILISYYAWWFGSFGPYGLLLVYVF
jgi:hypothetical protein